jgi:putative membrane protein
MYWVKFLHVLGVIVYVGGFMALTRLVGHAVKFESEESRRDAYRIYRRMHMFADWGGLAVAIIFGFILLMQSPNYMKQGWFHAKLLFVLLMLVVDVVFSIILFKKLKAEGPQPKRAVFSAIHGIAALILVGMLISLFPFGMR